MHTHLPGSCVMPRRPLNSGNSPADFQALGCPSTKRQRPSLNSSYLQGQGGPGIQAHVDPGSCGPGIQAHVDPGSCGPGIQAHVDPGSCGPGIQAHVDPYQTLASTHQHILPDPSGAAGFRIHQVLPDSGSTRCRMPLALAHGSGFDKFRRGWGREKRAERSTSRKSS